MTRLVRRFLTLALLLGAATANAAFIPMTWTDSDSHGGGVYVGAGGSVSDSLDIANDGFVAGRDIVTDFLFSLICSMTPTISCTSSRRPLSTYRACLVIALYSILG